MRRKKGNQEARYETYAIEVDNNDALLRESAQIEEEVGGHVEAGLALKEYSRAINPLAAEQSQQLRKQMRVQSILFTGLRQWMEAWDLGAGFEDTYVFARRLIRAHLANSTPTQQAFIEGLLAKDAQADSANKLTEQQVVVILSEIFTPEDWQAMAKAASQSISSRVLSAGQAQTETSVA